MSVDKKEYLAKHGQESWDRRVENIEAQLVVQAKYYAEQEGLDADEVNKDIHNYRSYETDNPELPLVVGLLGKFPWDKEEGEDEETG